MSSPTAEYIEKLCDDWCSASTLPNGGIAIGGVTEKYRLLANSIKFHDLSHEALCAAVIGLSKVLLRPGLNTFVDQDHFALWSWCGELLLGSRSSLYSVEQHEIKSLYETCIHAALAPCRKPPKNQQEWKEQNDIDDLQPHHARQLNLKSSLVLAYLGFPLLEAVLKRACSAYVSFDGQVISSFSVPTKQGGSKTYGPDGRFQQCSSLRDLLFLHVGYVASQDLKAHMSRFSSHIMSVDNTKDPFDLLYAWRNQSLHGSTNFQTIGGILLNLALLISIFDIERCFDQYRLQVLENCRWQEKSSRKSPWSFYPPY